MMRVVHCKREAYDVYIGRPSKWGNPFPVPSRNYDRAADPARIVERYEAYVRSKPGLMAALPELRGKVLGCWCAPQRCHGDVLVKLVAELDPPPRIYEAMGEMTPEKKRLEDIVNRAAADVLRDAGIDLSDDEEG